MGLRSMFRVISALLLAFTLSAAQVRVEELTILSAERTIDVSSQVVLMNHKLKVENTNASPTKVFLFTVEPLLKSNLAFIGATAGKTGIYILLAVCFRISC
jgi:hypothetical protein